MTLAPARVLDLGVVDYLEAHALQKRLGDDRAAGAVPDTLLLLEHAHVFTRGRRSRDGNVILPGEVPVIDVERGGDVTYHGPGQLVAYPIFALAEAERDAPGFIRRLEGWVMAALADLGIPDTERRPGYSGVWCRDRKIASVGVAVTARWVTWHGVALNVTTDLAYFRRINPCGLDAGIMTSVAALLGAAPPMAHVKERLIHALPRHLGRHPEGSALDRRLVVNPSDV